MQAADAWRQRRRAHARRVVQGAHHRAHAITNQSVGWSRSGRALTLQAGLWAATRLWDTGRCAACRPLHAIARCNTRSRWEALCGCAPCVCTQVAARNAQFRSPPGHTFATCAVRPVGMCALAPTVSMRAPQVTGETRPRRERVMYIYQDMVRWLLATLLLLVPT